MSNPLIDSLLRAVEASPDDIPLRLHVADLMVAEGNTAEAITQIAMALQADPRHPDAIAAMASALQASSPAVTPASPAASPASPASPSPSPEPGEYSAPPAFTEPDPDDPWDRAAANLTDTPSGDAPVAPITHSGDPMDADTMWDVEEPRLTLDDVGGLHDVKERLEVSFLAPLRNPELRTLYGKSLRGGLLLYGPPGCGKTFIARAVAGEMGARFINVTLTDVLDMYIGNSEANLHGIFEIARGRTPCVVFLDEIDAIGQKRSQARHSATRGVVNQLLQELDGIGSDNEGVYVLAATNTPWDIDPALRRPGRLDRTVLVLPPDEAARLAILTHAMAQRPTERLDLATLARQTDGFTGADLAHLCESAAENALMESVRSGRPRPITMRDLQAARKQVRASAGPWFDAARTVVEYGDRSGEYSDLRDYMLRHKLL